MLASLSPLISRGVIDNTVRDIVQLRLWGADSGEALDFVLEGNCLPDIAGCRVNFTNRRCIPALKEEHPVLKRLRAETQRTLIGDITLSRRQPEPDNRRALQNILSVEFFIGTELRVLIESDDFEYDLSLPQWQMSWAESNAQALLNMENLRAHVAENVSHFCGPALADIKASGFPACKWDLRLNRAEAGMAIFPTIEEKYRFSPRRRAELAYVMGRTDILGNMAQEDEAHLPPDPAAEQRAWEVVDFLEPEYARSVKRAMHHPLFMETSRMTGLVQTRLMKANGQPQSKEAERFISGYAALVSHILATILLTRQREFNRDLALQRLTLIARRVGDLPALFDNPMGENNALIREATAALVTKLEDFSATLQH